jgi:hypothetical protein
VQRSSHRLTLRFERHAPRLAANDDAPPASLLEVAIELTLRAGAEARAEAAAADSLEVGECIQAGASHTMASGVVETMKTKFIIGVITLVALPIINMVIMPLVKEIIIPILKPIIKMMLDLIEAILNPLLKAAMGDDQNQGIFGGAFFGPYAIGLGAFQVKLMMERADALGLGPYRDSLAPTTAGGNSQLNGLFYALFVMDMVDRIGNGVVDGCMKFMTKPLNILIKILIPAEIGKFMIQEQPKLVGKAIVGPVTHGVVHGVTQAVTHGLTRSVTSAVTHALTRSQTHYYYCLYCYYHGAYCQFCEFYNEYAQLGNRAAGWGKYKTDGAAAGTEYAQLSRRAKAHGAPINPYEPRWDSEAACYTHFRPMGCMLKDADAPDAEKAVCGSCREPEYPKDMIAKAAGNFRECRDSDISAFMHQHVTFCVLPAGTPGLPTGLRMRVTPNPTFEQMEREPEGNCAPRPPPRPAVPP